MPMRGRSSSGLSTSTSFAGLLRSIYEGLGFAARDCYGVMGSIPNEIRLTGGAARSSTLLQIYADVLAAPVRRVLREETGAAGAAMIAALSLGLYPSLAACAQAWVTPTLGPLTRARRETQWLLSPAVPDLSVCSRGDAAGLGRFGASARGEAMTQSVAVIGDHFMLPRMLEDALREICGDALVVRTLEQPWPDEPMEHGYAKAGMDGLKEYMGEPDDIVAFVGDAPILVTHLAPLSAAMMDRLPRLKLVAVCRGGPVNIDISAARERGIQVVNTPGRNASAVAEFAIGAILSQTRMITRGHDALRRGEWRGDLYRADLTGDELSEMTVGVVGYGHIGTRVVRLLKAFGCRVLVCDPYVQLSVEDLRDGVVQVSLDRLLAQSNVISLHPRVTDETRGMIGAAQFAAMKPGCFFINTARGPLVDYQALYDALVSNHLRGAAIETFAIEPVPADWPLLQLSNVTLTPHIAGASVKTVRIAARLAAQEVRRYLDGEPLHHLC